MINKADLKHIDIILKFMSNAEASMTLKESKLVLDGYSWLFNLKKELEAPAPAPVIEKPVKKTKKKAK